MHSSRERFLLAMKFEETDRIPILSWDPWSETMERWKKEGMIDYQQEIAVFDGPMQSTWLYRDYHAPIPAFEEKVLWENDTHIRVQNKFGQIELYLKEGTSMPFHEKYPIKCRQDWEDYKKRLEPYDDGRYPEDWAELVEKRSTTDADQIRGVCVWGYYGFLREMFGIEQLSVMYYDDSSLIAEMNEYWLDFTIRRLERGVSEMDFDYALIWEDNCCKHGMLHSPEIFEKFMSPHYRKLIEFFNASGIDIISVDSDGDVCELIPLLLDVGVTAIHPFEVGAGMDVVKIGKEYPQLQIWGGIDKRALAVGPEAIDAELSRVLPAMKKRGGYAAGLDHLIPSDVSLENYRYYVKRLHELS